MVNQIEISEDIIFGNGESGNVTQVENAKSVGKRMVKLWSECVNIS